MQLSDITSDSNIFIDEEIAIEAFNMKSELSIKEDEQRVVATITVNGITQDGSLVTTTIANFTFIVENMKAIIKRNENNDIHIPKVIIEIINATALSTCRGIVYSSLKNSKLKNIIIPLIQTKSLTQLEEEKKD